jgi:transposase InsO family protein
VSHANARLTQYARLLAARRVEQGHKPGEVAKQLGVSRQTVYKWVRRLREEGPAGLVDRSSRPKSSPTRTSHAVELRIVTARVEEHAGPRVLAGLLELPASTIGAVIRRWQLPRLADLDRLTGEIVRSRATDVRYERDRPGELLHVDVKKLGKVPPGGGWRAHGRSEAVRGRGLGWDYVHVAVDDRSRIAYAEVLPDEKGPTCAAFLHRAATWLHEQHGVTVERVLTDNAKVYRFGLDWAAVCTALQIRRRFTKPRCPWTNGKAERFNRTLQTEWAYAHPWTSNDDRTAALTDFLDRYNTRRGHSALGGRPPISRLAA